jgi:hypothetical protein
VCRDDEPGPADARGKCGRAAGRKEEVPVNGIWAKSPCRRNRPRRQRGVFQRRAATTVDHDALELVPLPLELEGNLLHEDAEIRSRGARKHLRYQENFHVC